MSPAVPSETGDDHGHRQGDTSPGGGPELSRLQLRRRGDDRSRPRVQGVRARGHRGRKLPGDLLDNLLDPFLGALLDPLDRRRPGSQASGSL